MAPPDFDALAAEATELLQRYIRIDTTNPPGNESAACDFLAGVLGAEGIASTRYAAVEGRDNLVADLPGSDAALKPLVLLNHTDVVPAEADEWSVDPLAGELRDGFVWGRGALDMKGMAAVEVTVMLALKRRGIGLRRTLRLLAVADEEAGSSAGVEWLDEAHPELLDADAVINEGGYGARSFMGSDRPSFGVSAAEKSPLWLTLRTRGRPGHGSAPHDDNALDRMVRAMRRVADWRPEPVLTGPVAQAVQALYAEGYLDADPAQLSPELLAEAFPALRLILTNTISSTGLSSGIKHNVIPATATATLDCRLVPGYEAERFISELKSVIDDPRVEVETAFGSVSPSSSLDTELHAAIVAACREVVPAAAVLPRVSAGFTDSRTFRRRGVPAYGFVPMLLGPEEQGRMHGNDERISTANIRLAVEVLYRVVERYCL